jgi:hypothetical protein
MDKILKEDKLAKMVDLLTAIYQEGKAEDNDIIIACVKDILDVLVLEDAE